MLKLRHQLLICLISIISKLIVNFLQIRYTSQSFLCVEIMKMYFPLRLQMLYLQSLNARGALRFRKGKSLPSTTS